jgi:3-hydroxyisobutyrate dehydrogenase-like beta-hydroxyacid dehydrogenase
MRRVGLIGCGIVGGELGMRLLRSGFEVHVHDKHRDKADALLAAGAVWMDRLADLGRHSDVLVSSLPRPEDVQEALLGPDGAWAAAPPKTLHVDTSTIGVACARTLAAEAARRRIRYLDAPLSAAEARDEGPALTLFVGGHADYFDLARPLLHTLAEHVHFVGGSPGYGQVVKLVNNLASQAMTVALADALAIGVKAGVPIELLRAALHDGTAQCRLLDELLTVSILRRDWRPGLRLDLALKDLALAQELSRQTGAEAWLLDEVRAVHERALERGWGEASEHVVFRLKEEAAGVSFRSPIFEQVRPAKEDR